MESINHIYVAHSLSGWLACQLVVVVARLLACLLLLLLSVRFLQLPTQMGV
jgi:hypothetical protein